MRRAEPLDTRALTKQQYRYLKAFLQLLHDNGIAHGDLLGNVMLLHNPVLIDWDTAVLKTSNLFEITK